MALVFFLDTMSPLGLNISSLYVIALFLTYFTRSLVSLFVCAVASELLIICGYFLSHDIGIVSWVPIADCLISALIVFMASILGYVLISYKRHIKELRELLTMCAWTKKIKVSGEWIPVEEFLLKYLNITVSHGMSPEAAKKMAEEADSFLEKKKK